MKKLLFVGVLAGLLLIAVPLVGVNAQVSASNPLQAIWRAIDDLYNKIANIQLIPGPQGAQGPQGVPGTQLRIQDASGQDLGIPLTALAWGEDFVTYLPNEKILLAIDQSNSGNSIKLQGVIDYATVYFFSSDCTGEPYTSTYSYDGQFIRLNALDLNFKRLSYAVTSGTPTSKYEPGATTCQSNGSSGNFYPLQEFTLPFTLPLSGPLKIVAQ